MSPLQSPPADLAGFPDFRLSPERLLYLVHPDGAPPWTFSSDGSGRFDLRPPRGTCHLAEQPAGAFLEHFSRDNARSPQELDSRRLSAVRVPADLELADCLASGAARSGSPRRFTQARSTTRPRTGRPRSSGRASAACATS